MRASKISLGVVLSGILDLPERPLFQASIVHALLLRRVLCEKTQELWFDYKRLPVYFGLREFAIMTGLNCGHSYTNSKLQKYLLDGEELRKLIAKGKRIRNVVCPKLPSDWPPQKRLSTIIHGAEIVSG